jgi:hypothetical protein
LSVVFVGLQIGNAELGVVADGDAHIDAPQRILPNVNAGDLGSGTWRASFQQRGDLPLGLGDQRRRDIARAHLLRPDVMRLACTGELIAIYFGPDP